MLNASATQPLMPAALDANPAPLPSRLDPAQQACLAHVLQVAAASGYRFITPTPLTHQRVLNKAARRPDVTLRDIFGWNLPFAADAISADLLDVMVRTGIAHPCGHLWRSGVRIASIDDLLFLHSPFPTVQDDAVFFGPDTYRFVRFIRQSLQRAPLPAAPASLRLLDVGCGSGAGGIVAAGLLAAAAGPVSLYCNDINPLALQYVAINAAQARQTVQLAPGDALSAVSGEFDLIISNPPYLNDPAQRAYRHGGGRLGSGLSLRIATEALGRLAPGGILLLYTGVAISGADDPFLAELLPILASSDCEWTYEEIDPDVFGEELEQPGYASTERIAAIGLVARRRKRTH